ncbi:hypothetical protein CRYUN_Cryun10bG0065900 [Craigia yunnanensis]
MVGGNAPSESFMGLSDTRHCAKVFLISTRAGGLGLNLRRHVVVFRLLAVGSLEELVYSRWVYKQQLSNIVVFGKMEKRYFEGVQDCKEFQGELFGICNLFRDLSDEHFTSILYAHHNEDIVNSRPGIQQKIKVNVTEDDNLRRDANASWKRKSDGDENVVSTREWKKIQYGRLAQFKGMRVVEFSSWVLSATPSERECALQDYKRRKKDTSDG